MSKPVYPRPGIEKAPAISRGKAVSTVDADVLVAAGIDPATISTEKPKGSQDAQSEADIVEAEVIRDCLADDLSHSEALTFAGAFWQGTHRANTDRARSTWRIITFMSRHPHCGWNDIPPELLDSSFFDGYAQPRKSISSLIHWWFANGSFARAEAQLNAYPLKRWSEHRRQQMAAAVAWEKDVQARTAAKRKARLLKNVRKDIRVRPRKESKS